MMKVKDLMNMNVSLYRRVNDNRQMRAITLDDWLHKVSPASRETIERLREVNLTDPKGAKAMKTVNLPCITISGVFEDERKTDRVSSTNPVICVDIDEKPEGMGWEELKDRVFSLPYVFYVSLSCRGNGIFALVYYDMENPLLGVFKALEMNFGEMGITLDRACKDICRLRFVSYDPRALEKEDVEMYEGCLLREFSDPVFVGCGSGKGGKVRDEVLDDYFTYRTIAHLITRCGYRSDTYDDWLKDGFRLATFGNYGHSLFMFLSQMSEGYNEYVAERKWKECERSTNMTRESLTYYYKVAKERLGPDWRRIVRNG